MQWKDRWVLSCTDLSLISQFFLTLCDFQANYRIPLRLSFSIWNMGMIVHNLYFVVDVCQVIFKGLGLATTTSQVLNSHSYCQSICVHGLYIIKSHSYFDSYKDFCSFPVYWFTLPVRALFFDSSLLTENGTNCITGQNLYLESEPAARSQIYWCVREGIALTSTSLKSILKILREGRLIEWWRRDDML